jgi:2,3-bisphosphoglycerate-independent phosphoglycerate mutase
MAKKNGLTKVFVHGILDGRDVSERTADIYTEALEIKMADIGVGRFASLCGRYYAMDKNLNWERTVRAYTMLIHAEGERAADGVTAIRDSFLRGITDEFIQPIVLEETPGVPVATVKNGDAVIFFNHRGDRIRQLVKALSVNETDDSSGDVIRKPEIETVCLTEYDRSFNLPVAFAPDAETNVLAQVFANHGVLNCRLTETEKYAHVTYFFNGGVEVEHPCEQRILIPSPKNQFNEYHPEMGCFKVTDKLLRGLEAGENDVFIVNLGAPDVIAHSGDLQKTIEAVQFVDTCLGGIVNKISDVGGVAIITSDHGNCEEMIDAATGAQHNSHTKNPVPFHLVGESANGLRLRTDGALEDIAPTILGILGIEKPAEMTGRDLRIDK